MRGGVDPVRASGHDRETALGGIEGNSGRDVLTVCRRAAGPDDGDAPLREVCQVAPTSDPEAERRTASPVTWLALQPLEVVESRLPLGVARTDVPPRDVLGGACDLVIVSG